jgi:hypothetical protein
MRDSSARSMDNTGFEQPVCVLRGPWDNSKNSSTGTCMQHMPLPPSSSCSQCAAMLNL